jgi:hypothetical protein
VADDSLVAALARAQAAFPKIGKAHENSHFRSKYADIADVLDAVRPVLAAEGIAVSQPTRVTEHGVELLTVLMKGTERMESSFPMPANLKPQDTLAWSTYLRRGQLCSMLGIHPSGEDDDGNTAQAAQAPARKKIPAKVTEDRTPRNTDAPMPDGEALSFDQLVQINEHWNTYTDADVRKARKREFAARFGDPKTATVDQWPAIEAFMAEAPF